ncbi:hypothetical protein [Paludisphaera mucosa]|uniref:Uncharacterized protein n=1 Tax=Paludisphaera mucosa TaxID=3030827 RepID=A0ABT6FBR1_9BACT|nr:hypothetical protein [Paludisphaera mucosa]MDG3005034.1 hypothetical protein [Paludisphaera mucosa]
MPAVNLSGVDDDDAADGPSRGGRRPVRDRFGVVFARLLIGLMVLICAEVFSGASLGIGLWNPWTLVMTFWLYFAHFFFFTTLAIWTGRTSFWALYLWGVLYGLYESWITKVIWYGYGGDGKVVMGRIGAFGFSEMSMAFIFHPVMSFIVPLAVACVLCPPLRRSFPDLAWLTGASRRGRTVQAYLVASFAPVVAINSGGPANLAANAAFVTVLLPLLLWLAAPALAASDGPSIVAFRRPGFVGLCVYLALLYGLTYGTIRPEGLPSVGVQLLTLGFYAVAIAGLALHRRRERLEATSPAVAVDPREITVVTTVLGLVIGLGFVLSWFRGVPVLFLPMVANFVIWTLLGFVLTAIALAAGVRERIEGPARA